jgi:hypothetical protein
MWVRIVHQPRSMFRPAMSAVAVTTLLMTLAACAADPDAPTVEASVSAPRPFVLLPTAPGVARECAAELGASYCDENAARAASRRCEEKMGRDACGGAACTEVYAQDRTTCRAGPTYPTPAACEQPAVDDCSFYRSCLDAKHPCGEDGYALAYGERLCYAFIEKKEGFSSEGQRWLKGVRSCLQRELVPLLHRPATCGDLLTDAYATHPGCYTTRGNSICTLPPSDVLELASIIGNDLLSVRALSQMRQVAATCVLHWFDFSVAEDAPKREFFRQLEVASSNETDFRAFVKNGVRGPSQTR